MKTFALAVLISVAFVTGAFALVMWSRTAGEVATFRDWGVCVAAPEPGYSIESSQPADFYLVDVSAAAGHRMRIYIGGHPQVSDAAIDAARYAGGALIPVSGQDGQFVAVEPQPGYLILHVMLDDAHGADRERLLAGVRFCPNDPA